MGTTEVVRVLANRLRQLDAAELPTSEKSRLTASLADSLLRAIGVDVLDKRLEALQDVLIGRKDKEEKMNTQIGGPTLRTSDTSRTVLADPGRQWCGVTMPKGNDWAGLAHASLCRCPTMCPMLWPSWNWLSLPTSNCRKRPRSMRCL